MVDLCFFVKQKTAYELRISDWSSDVCASDLNNVSNSPGAVLKPAGLEHAQGIISAFYHKDPTDPQWKDDAAWQEWSAFMDEHYPDGDKTSTFTVFGYLAAQTMEQVLRQCGDELTRENVMKQAASLKDLELGMMLPGILLNTGPDDFFPIEQMRLRSEEHTSELQSLMRNSYAVFC